MRIKSLEPARVAKYIEKHKGAQSILRKADSNPALFQSLTVFTLATLVRPSTIMATPAKTSEGKKDKLYSASRSIMTGIVDLSTAFIIFLPLNKILNKTGRKLYNTLDSIYHNNKEACSNFKSLSNRFIKFGIIPFVAYLNFKYVKDMSNKITSLLYKGKNNDNSKNSTK